MFNLFDLFALIIVLLAGFFGFQTGILASVFYIVSGFAGMFIAQKFSAQLGINFYILFFLAGAVVILIGFYLGRLLNSIFLSPVDRLCGVLLGAVLGGVIVIAVAVPLTGNLLPKSKKNVASSFTVARAMPRLQKLAPGIADFNPGQIKRALPDINVPEKAKLKLSVSRKTPPKN